MTPHVLVTGGSGFLGSHLVRELATRGRGVRVLDRVRPHDPVPGVDYVLGDVTDPDTVARALDGVDTVFHLAAKAGLWASDPGAFERVNGAACRTVFGACERRGVSRVVHCSTEAVFKSRRRGRVPRNRPIDEDLRLRLDDMVGPYARGKFIAEQEALAAAERGLHVVIVNPTIPLGPGDWNLTPPARMLLGFLNGRHPAYLEGVFNFVDARDVALGHIAAAERGRPGQRYLLAGHDLRMSEFLALVESLTGLPMPRLRVPYAVAVGAALGSEALARLTGRRPASPLTGVRLARDPNTFSNRRAREKLGVTFRPLAETVRDAVAWYAERGLLKRRPHRTPLVRAERTVQGRPAPGR
ncbi:MAG: NAD-dependent epimerase/dehydratase family protein [Gemmatimonadetes bacterium]|nr:MAG: NAD-dependent epimerase/dehydratase family protein [Gemmatimonadota bacterium]